MAIDIDHLKNADQAAVGVYMPYYQGVKRTVLPMAISLYQHGSLEGQRQIEGGENIPFVATWYVSKLPAELTRCRLQFQENAELNYEVMLANSEFVNYLIELIMNYKRSKLTDFPQAFYRKLLRIDE